MRRKKQITKVFNFPKFPTNAFDQNIQYSPVSGIDSFTFVFVTSLFIFIKEWIICNRSLSGACGYNSAIEECVNSSSCDPQYTQTHTHAVGFHSLLAQHLTSSPIKTCSSSVILAVTCGSFADGGFVLLSFPLQTWIAVCFQDKELHRSSCSSINHM